MNQNQNNANMDGSNEKIANNMAVNTNLGNMINGNSSQLFNSNTNMQSQSINNVVNNSAEVHPVQPNNNVNITNVAMDSTNASLNQVPNVSQQISQPILGDAINNNTNTNLQGDNNIVNNSQFINQQPVSNASSTLPIGDNEKKKGNNIIVRILIIILLIAIGIAVGYFLYTKFGGKQNNTNNDENTSVVDDTTTILNTNVLDNIDVNMDDLSQVLDILGIAATSDVNNDDFLNYYVSNENYSEYAREIISYYGNRSEENGIFGTVPENVEHEIVAGLFIISKENAENIFKMYNFDGNIDDYFMTDSNLDNEYLFIVTNTSIPSTLNGPDFHITHNMTSEYFDTVNIRINDNQVVSSYSEDGTLQSVNKIVTYEFNKEDEIYYLSQVKVVEE